MSEKVTAIFDIGKTNKKLFLFDEDLNEVYNEYVRFDEIGDEDGFPSEDLMSLTRWIKASVRKVLEDKRYDLQRINFSTYGASLVHLDRKGKVVTPFYNYLKTFDPELYKSFFDKYGDEQRFSLETSSPIMGFLNSGFQFFYLKEKKPEIFKQISHSLHFPQYLSYILTQKLCSDYTSIGCHTIMWDFPKKQFHSWLKEEGALPLLPEIFPSDHSFEIDIEYKKVKVGVGVHDSSAALVPYIQASQEPFVLISTGTWSICMNYFNEEELTYEELEQDCLNFLSVKGSSIKASRLFLGKHFEDKIRELNSYFDCESDRYKEIAFDPSFSVGSKKGFLFDHSLLKPERFGFTNNTDQDISVFKSFEEAYHQLNDELVELQIASLKLAIGKSEVKTIYLDGGFTGNEVFMQLLANKLSDYHLYSSSFAKGTALGAAILVNKAKLSPDFLKKNYKLKLHEPLGEKV